MTAAADGPPALQELAEALNALAPHNVLAALLSGGARPLVIQSPAERGPGPRVPRF